VKARDPAIVHSGKGDLDGGQCSEQERDRKAFEFDPGDEGSEEDEDGEAVRQREAQVFVQVKGRRAENPETGRQDLHHDSE